MGRNICRHKVEVSKHCYYTGTSIYIKQLYPNVVTFAKRVARILHRNFSKFYEKLATISDYIEFLWNIVSLGRVSG